MAGIDNWFGGKVALGTGGANDVEHHPTRLRGGPHDPPLAESKEFTDMFQHSISGRCAKSERMAGTVLHLCPDAASFVNGAIWTLDRGQAAH